VISKIKPLNPDIVATSLTTLPANVLFMQQARELNLNAKVFYTAVGPGVQPDWSNTLGKAGEYTLGQSFWEPGLPEKYYPGTAAFTEAYRNKYSEDPNYYGAGGYAHAKLIEIAIRQYFNQYGKVKIDGEKLRDIISNINTSEDGNLFGPVKFNQQGFIPTRHCVIIQTQNGQKIPVILPDGSPYGGNSIWFPVPPWNQRP
jgi:ABC-type branched-subunit amino acid transport system substrate-binding protein